MQQDEEPKSCHSDMEPVNSQQRNEYKAFQNLSRTNNIFHSMHHNNFPAFPLSTNNFPLSSASNTGTCNNYAVGQTPSYASNSNYQPSYPQQSFDSNYTSATLTLSSHSFPFQQSSKQKQGTNKHSALPIPQPANNNIKNTLQSPCAYKYTAINRIGTGTFGDIWSVIDNYDLCKNKQQRYAIKMIKNKAHWNSNQRKKYEITFINEGKTIMNLNNIKTNESGKDFIIKCKELLYLSNDNCPILNLVHNEKNEENKKSTNELTLIGPCIVMELCGYSLLQYIKLHEYTKYQISLSTIRYIAIQIFSAMSFIHGVGNCIHADLKPENILIDYSDCYNVNNKLSKFPRIKIVDFGNAISVNKKLKSFNIQTLWYRSPEVLFGNFDEMSPLIDMWSIGCILFELLLINNCNEYCRLFRCKEQKKTAVIHKIYNKVSAFPHYIYNNHKSCHYKDIYLEGRVDESCYLKLKNQTKSKLINNNLESNLINCMNPDILCFIDLLSGLLDVNPLTRYTSEDSIRHKFIITDYKHRHAINKKIHPIIKTSNDIERQHRINIQIKEYQSNIQNTHNVHKHDADPFPVAISKQHLY